MSTTGEKYHKRWFIYSINTLSHEILQWLIITNLSFIKQTLIIFYVYIRKHTSWTLSKYYIKRAYLIQFIYSKLVVYNVYSACMRVCVCRMYVCDTIYYYMRYGILVCRRNYIIKDDIDNNLNSYLNNNINNIILSLSPFINMTHLYIIFYITYVCI